MRATVHSPTPTGLSDQGTRSVPEAATSRVGKSRRVDPRGQRFAASITVVVLAGALLSLGQPLSAALLVGQGVVFAVGAYWGPAATPYARAFRHWVAPRIGPPAHLEDAAPPRFAQLVGLLFITTAIAGLVLGASVVVAAAAAAALAAALLNAAFGICLGCDGYLLGRRALHRQSRSQRGPSQSGASLGGASRGGTAPDRATLA